MTPTPCRPRRSWIARRRVAAAVCTAASIGVLAVALGGPWRRDGFAPGELSQPHAQILGGQLPGDRCAACHAAAQGRLSTWFGSGRDGHVGVTQTQLCVDCHHTTIPAERARTAHNLTIEGLRRIAAERSPAERTWHDSMPRPSFAVDDVQCAACHREHRGSRADLSRMSAAQCQACHSDRFASFADGHPDWQRWPYGRGGQIAFDHATHRDGHFARQGERFDCRSCHSVALDGSIARAGSFEVSCAACHDQSLRIEGSGGIDLIALPTLDIEAVREHRIAIQPWPASADGVDDLVLPPLMRILLSTDPEVAKAIDLLTDPAARLWNGPASADSLRATADLAAATCRLLEALSRDVYGEIQRRRGNVAAQVVGQLSPQTIAAARQRWFEEEPRLALEGSGGSADHSVPPVADGPDSDDLLLSDPLWSNEADDPLRMLAPSDDPETHGTERHSVAFDPDAVLPLGGWYRDDLRLAIRYRAAGHADPVLRAAMELASEAEIDPSQREALLGLPAVMACAKCHRGVRSAQPATWRAIRSDANRSTFTRFSHRPHLNLPELADCTQCHQIRSDARGGVTAVSVSSAARDHGGFAALDRAACVRCHTPQAAGDSCTQCHRYHVGPQPR